MRDEQSTPFRGKHIELPQHTRVVARFTKPDDKIAELRERKVTQFAALEWLLVVNGQMIETRMYHGARLPAYASELEECLEHLRKDGWQEVPLSASPH